MTIAELPDGAAGLRKQHGIEVCCEVAPCPPAAFFLWRLEHG